MPRIALGSGGQVGAVGTAGSAGKAVTTLTQTAFDPRLKNSLTAPFQSGPITLYRGFIIWDPVEMGTYYTGQTPPSVRFLFNPSTISASYQMSSGMATAALIFPSSSNSATLRVPLQQQVGFTIMFDRTYEMNWKALNSPAPPAVIQNIGVEADIRLFKQITGMYNQVYAGNNPYYSTATQGSNIGNQVGSVKNSAVNSTPNPNGTGISQGVMQFTFCYVYFSYPGTGLEYYGYIDSWDVSYTHFNESMVPMRAVVDVSFTLLPPPTSNVQPATASTTAVTQVANGGVTVTAT